MACRKFEYIEHTADVMYKAFGRSIEECFENSCLAMNDTFAELSKIRQGKEVRLECRAGNEEELLHAFLEKALFEMQTGNLAFPKTSVEVRGKKCRAVLGGGKAGGKTKTDVKAVTWNSFYLKKTGKGWESRVLLDV